MLDYNIIYSIDQHNVRRSKPSSRVVPVKHAVRSNRRTHHTQLPPADSDTTAKPSDTVQSQKSADLLSRELDGSQVSEEKQAALDNCCKQGLDSHRESAESELSEELEVLHLNEVANNPKDESSNEMNTKLFAFCTNSLTPSGTDTLLTAAAQGDTQYLTELITSQSAGRVGVDATDAKGRTALMHATYEGHKDCIKLLLEAGTVLGSLL